MNPPFFSQVTRPNAMITLSNGLVRELLELHCSTCLDGGETIFVTDAVNSAV
jgi:hypothetical protein